MLGFLPRRFPLRSRFVKRVFSTCQNGSTLSTCIIGSGPGGLYTARYLLKKVPNVHISILDSVPTPFGLVRFGVAPDHSDTKNVVNDFTDVLRDPRVSYFGNVTVGGNSNVAMANLRQYYHSIVLAYGASRDRLLNISGEQQYNSIYPARAFVNWYNGHPWHINDISQSDLTPDSKAVAIIGQGNVAIDCARILASPTARLASTDIAQHALDKLAKGTIRDIYLIGRRGPIQAAFTNKELREVIDGSIDGLIATVNYDELHTLARNAESMEEMKQRAVKRKVSILERATIWKTYADLIEIREKNPDSKFIHFRFLMSPTAFSNDDNGRVNGLECQRTALSGETGAQKAVISDSGVTINIDCGMVLKSVGYQSMPLEGESELNECWQSGANIVCNRNGRIEAMKGCYTAGWVSRGPTGIIGTNIPDGKAVANAIEQDWTNGALTNDSIHGQFSEERLRDWLNTNGSQFVDKEGWFRIDAEEVKRGQKIGKPREKFTDIQEMIGIANQTV